MPHKCTVMTLLLMCMYRKSRHVSTAWVSKLQGAFCGVLLYMHICIHTCMCTHIRVYTYMYVCACIEYVFSCDFTAWPVRLRHHAVHCRPVVTCSACMDGHHIGHVSDNAVRTSETLDAFETSLQPLARQNWPNHTTYRKEIELML